MKKLIFIAFFIPCLIRKTYAQERDSSDFLMAIGVKSNLETIIAVDCEEFTNSFKNRLTYKGIFDKDTLLLFQKFVKHAHFRKENDVIDVRRKFILYENDKITIQVCSNEWDIMINGRIIKKNKAFLRFLDILATQNMIPYSIKK
jgi:hypothetical protein